MHLTSILRCATITAALCATAAFAQEAKLTADATTLSDKGGVITFTATTTYGQTPGALGWSIVLPADWSLVAVAGTHVPDIAPARDATGTLEFAYTSPPASGASFMVTARYPGGAVAARVTSTAIVRTNGKLATLNPAPINLPVVR
jgi:hypothetical protein